MLKASNTLVRGIVSDSNLAVSMKFFLVELEARAETPEHRRGQFNRQKVVVLVLSLPTLHIFGATLHTLALRALPALDSVELLNCAQHRLEEEAVEGHEVGGHCVGQLIYEPVEQDLPLVHEQVAAVPRLHLALAPGDQVQERFPQLHLVGLQYQNHQAANLSLFDLFDQSVLPHLLVDEFSAGVVQERQVVFEQIVDAGLHSGRIKLGEHLLGCAGGPPHRLRAHLLADVQEEGQMLQHYSQLEFGGEGAHKFQ